MTRIVIAAALSLALAACGSGDEGSIRTEDGEVEYDVDAAGENSEIRFRSADGEQVSVDSASTGALDLPAGFDIYPGAGVVSSTTIDQADGHGVIVVMTSPGSPDAMAQYYRAQAEAAGIAIQMEMISESGTLIGGEGANGETFSFNASLGEDGTTAQLVVGRTDQ